MRRQFRGTCTSFICISPFVWKAGVPGSVHRIPAGFFCLPYRLPVRRPPVRHLCVLSAICRTHPGSLFPMYPPEGKIVLPAAENSLLLTGRNKSPGKPIGPPVSANRPQTVFTQKPAWRWKKEKKGRCRVAICSDQEFQFASQAYVGLTRLTILRSVCRLACEE